MQAHGPTAMHEFKYMNIYTCLKSKQFITCAVAELFNSVREGI